MSTFAIGDVMSVNSVNMLAGYPSVLQEHI